MFVITLFVIAGLLQLWAIIMLFRNERVYYFRKHLLDELDYIVRDEVAIPLLQEMRRVSYHDMVWQWWKPCKSFYSKELLKLLE